MELIMEFNLVTLIFLVILYFVLNKVIKTWIRVLEKLSGKAEQWVDNIDTTISQDKE